MHVRLTLVVSTSLLALAAGCGAPDDSTALAQAVERIKTLETKLAAETDRVNAKLAEIDKRASPVPDSISARAFVLVGEDGKPVAKFAIDPAGAALQFGGAELDSSYLRVGLIGDAPAINLQDSGPSPSQVRLGYEGLTVTRSAKGSPSASLVLGADGTPSLELRGRGERPGAVSIQVLGSAAKDAADTMLGAALISLNAKDCERSLDLAAFRDGECAVNVPGKEKSGLHIEGTRLNIHDERGTLRADVGSVELRTKSSGAITKYPGAIAIYGDDGAVLWMEPR